MLLKPYVSDGGIARQTQAGDTIAGTDVLTATIATTNITLTGAQLLSGYIERSPAAPGTDTIDTAANIIAAVSGGQGAYGVQNGTTWKFKEQVTTANAVTLTATANTGVTVTRGTINASSCKEFLVTVVNGNPAAAVYGNTTNASPIITGMTSAQTMLLEPGMIVTNAVNGLQGTTILSVQEGVGVTLSGNANATSSTLQAISFSPVITITGMGQGLI